MTTWDQNQVKTKNGRHADCPIGDLLARLGDKWSMFVIVALAEAEQHCLRFSELMRKVEGISQKMLTTTLRNLERDGMVERHVYPEIPPRVEYTLTQRGLNFLQPVKSLITWITGEWPDIEKSRQYYDTQLHNSTQDKRRIQRGARDSAPRL